MVFLLLTDQLVARFRCREVLCIKPTLLDKDWKLVHSPTTPQSTYVLHYELVMLILVIQYLASP